MLLHPVLDICEMGEPSSCSGSISVVSLVLADCADTVVPLGVQTEVWNSGSDRSSKLVQAAVAVSLLWRSVLVETSVSSEFLPATSCWSLSCQYQQSDFKALDHV